MNHPRSRQHGGMLSLLLTLLVVGVLAYFALRPHPAAQQGAEDQQPPAAACTRLAGDLVRRTGGIGAEYKAGYAALPPGCRRILPPPVEMPDAAEPQNE